jgi:uncharacterized phage protein gp47/JayE
MAIEEYGLTSDGLNLPRAADWLQLIQDDYEERTGLTIDWDRDVFLGNISAVLADRLGELSEITQAVYDAMTPGNATGVQLDALVSLAGITRDPATYSQATVTLATTGAANVLVTEGHLVEGGGENDDARWATSEDVTIPAGGSVTVVVVAQEPGAISASPGVIDKIVTAVAGWTSVFNASSATPGDDLETDAALRTRWQASLQSLGTASVNAIRGRIAELDYITAVVVIENDDGAAAIVEGITMSPSSIAVIVAPNTLTTAQKQEVAETIYSNTAGGIRTVGTDVVATVTDAAGSSKTVRYGWAVEVTVTVAFTVTLEPGYVIGDVDDALAEAVADHFVDLSVGDDVLRLAMFGLAADVTGIRAVTALLLNGANTDITIDATEYASLTLPVVVTT